MRRASSELAPALMLGVNPSAQIDPAVQRMVEMGFERAQREVILGLFPPRWQSYALVIKSQAALAMLYSCTRAHTALRTKQKTSYYIINAFFEHSFTNRPHTSADLLQLNE